MELLLFSTLIAILLAAVAADNPPPASRPAPEAATKPSETRPLNLKRDGAFGFPHAFIIGRDGKLAWQGNPGSADFEKHLLAALEAK